MRRFLLMLLLVFAPCITISATIRADNILFADDFESGLTAWQTKHLLPGDKIRCEAGNCYFKWSKATSGQSRVIMVTVAYPGSGGQLLGLAGDFTVSAGASVYLRLTIPGQKTRCKHIVKPSVVSFAVFSCASTIGVNYTQIHAKISTRGGGKVRADNVRIAIINP